MDDGCRRRQEVEWKPYDLTRGDRDHRSDHDHGLDGGLGLRIAHRPRGDIRSGAAIDNQFRSRAKGFDIHVLRRRFRSLRSGLLKFRCSRDHEGHIDGVGG